MDELAEHNWHRFADSDVASPGLPHSSQVLYSCLRSFKVVHGRACILAALIVYRYGSFLHGFHSCQHGFIPPL